MSQPPTPVLVRPKPLLGERDLATVNDELEDASPEAIVGWAHDRFGERLALTASFADTVLIDVATRIAPDVEVVFLDTGFHFAETLHAVRRAMERYSLNLTVLRPPADADDVWGSGTDACCGGRKVTLLDRHLVGRVDAWMSGVRRADSAERASAPIVSIDRRGLVKVNPLANVSDVAYESYVVEHDVIVNSLAFDGYTSIGCWPCTERSDDGRAGRWGGTKTECGLHL